MTLEETAAVLAVLSTAWPDRFDERKGVDQRAAVKGYYVALGDLPADAVNAAAERWLRTGKFFPAPSELRELALASAIGLPSAEEAWGEVRRAIGEVGMYRIPRWSTKVLQLTVETLGWGDICRTEEDNAPTLRAQFRNTYQRIATRQQEGDAGPALAEARERRAELAELGKVAGYFGPGQPVRALGGGARAALPPAGDDWQARYQAMGTDAFSTQQARKRHAEDYPGRDATAPPYDPRALLIQVAAVPGWWEHTKDWRERQIGKHVARHPELGELPALLAEMEAEHERARDGAA